MQYIHIYFKLICNSIFLARIPLLTIKNAKQTKILYQYMTFSKDQVSVLIHVSDTWHAICFTFRNTTVFAF